MLTVLVARPPRFGGKVASVDDTVARAVPGVADVKQISSGVAVYANGFWPARKGREALRIREAKNGAERTVILGPTAPPRSVRGLRAARRARGRAVPAAHEVVVLSNRGTGVSYDAVHYQWARLCRAAGLVDEAGAPRYTPHQLRHTRGSELIAQEQRMEIVLGHRDIGSTLGYAELREAQVRAALEGTPRR